MNAQKLLNELRRRESTDSPPSVTLRALVPCQYVNKLYNTAKGTINHLNSQFGVKIYALSGDGLRLLFVTGSPQGISKAWGHLFSFFLRFSPLQYGKTPGMCFLIPDKLAEILQEDTLLNISHLESIAKRSKTEFRLKKNVLPNSTDRILRISVPSLEDDISKSFTKAVFLLALSFQQHLTVVYSPFNIYYQQQDRQAEYIQDDDDEIVYAPRKDVITGKWNNDFLN